MNKRIVKAIRANHDFKAEWYTAQRWSRMTEVEREMGIELQHKLMQQWIKSRKAWC